MSDPTYGDYPVLDGREKAWHSAKRQAGNSLRAHFIWAALAVLLTVQHEPVRAALHVAEVSHPPTLENVLVGQSANDIHGCQFVPGRHLAGIDLPWMDQLLFNEHLVKNIWSRFVRCCSTDIHLDGHAVRRRSSMVSDANAQILLIKVFPLEWNREAVSAEREVIFFDRVVVNMLKGDIGPQLLFGTLLRVNKGLLPGSVGVQRQLASHQPKCASDERKGNGEKSKDGLCVVVKPIPSVGADFVNERTDRAGENGIVFFGGLALLFWAIYCFKG